MKNYEKYADKIKEYNDSSFCLRFVEPYVLNEIGLSCSRLGCSKCRVLQTVWLMKEYVEPQVDWSRIEVDTPILVRDFEGSDWFRRHFAKYENGTVYAWDGGDTSWSGGDVMTDWKYAKLAESEEE